MLRILFNHKSHYIALLCLMLNFLIHAPASALEPHLRAAEHGQQWTGFAATEQSWFAYMGGTYAPFDLIENNGWRLRASAGYGQYYYDSTLNISGENIPVRFSGETSSVEGLLGYQFRLGDWTGKLFAGIHHQEHLIQPFDPGNLNNGADTGFKVASENWLNLGKNAYASLDGYYSTSFKSYAIELKSAYNLIGPFYLGALIGGFGNQSLEAARAGVLIRYRDDSREITLTGGVSGDYDAPSSPFASITLLTAF